LLDNPTKITTPADLVKNVNTRTVLKYNHGMTHLLNEQITHTTAQQQVTQQQVTQSVK